MLVFFSWIVSFRKLPVTCTAQHWTIQQINGKYEGIWKKLSWPNYSFFPLLPVVTEKLWKPQYGWWWSRFTRNI
jgi:hypothetical protein